MKRILIVLAILCLVGSVQAQDTEIIAISNKAFLTVEIAQLGAVVMGTNAESTLLEVKPFVGTGLNFSLMEIKKRYGANAFALFYTDGDMVYPMAAFGFTLMNKRFAAGYDFGTVKNKFDKAWQERLRILVSFNPFE